MARVRMFARFSSLTAAGPSRTKIPEESGTGVPCLSAENVVLEADHQRTIKSVRQCNERAGECQTLAEKVESAAGKSGLIEVGGLTSLASMKCISSIAALLLALLVSSSLATEMQPIALSARVTRPQPMTGIVLWSTNEKVESAPIQLEYSYLTYDRVVRDKGRYDWSQVEKLLDEAAARKHQVILRWHDTYVGKPTGVPAYIKALPDYQETKATSENRPTSFPDWSHSELRQCVLDFFTEFARNYDRDPRIAFIEVGFGLWGEYHIYDGPMKLGHTFPTKEFQTKFVEHLGKEFQQTPWLISVDAAGDHTPFVGRSTLRAIPFGLFDDSFNHATHKRENEPNWNLLGRDRWKVAPCGGEFSFFERKDQTEALAPKGPHGISFEEQAAKFHISFMIGDSQPRYQSNERILKAGLACGYRFQVTAFESGDNRSSTTIRNNGIAPIYHDAYPSVNGVRSQESLKGLLPGKSRTFAIASGGIQPRLTIECDRLVPGQRIEFDAALP